jgi:[ribosomal protein S18]-alanine N-acetyltransferase
MRVRPATAADISAMMRLENHSSTAAHWSRGQYELVFGQDAPRRAAWVIEDEGEGSPKHLHGFLVAHEVAGEWEIENIVVEQLMRRQRLATRLLVELQGVARAERAKAIFLEVRESNQDARAFYERRGFQQTGRRPRYYSDPNEDAITYRLSLA